MTPRECRAIAGLLAELNERLDRVAVRIDLLDERRDACERDLRACEQSLGVVVDSGRKSGIPPENLGDQADEQPVYLVAGGARAAVAASRARAGVGGGS